MTHVLKLNEGKQKLSTSDVKKVQADNLSTKTMKGFMTIQAGIVSLYKQKNEMQNCFYLHTKFGLLSLGWPESIVI